MSKYYQITLSIADNDNSATNEIELPPGGSSGQVLSTNGSGTYNWVNQTVSTNTDNQNLSLGTISGTMVPLNISGGTGATINVADNDNSTTNEIQNLSATVSGTSRTIAISGGTNATINVADNDNNASNELQNLSATVSGTSRTIAISGGTNATINVADNDNSSTNEIQTISAGGTTSPTVNLSNTGGTVTFAPGTNVTLSRTGNTITINSTGGGGSSSCSSFGDGTAGNFTISGSVNWSTTPPTNGNFQFDNLTINSGATLTVASGTIIRTKGNFVNNGTIEVLPGLEASTWGGHADGGFNIEKGFAKTHRRGFTEGELHHVNYIGPIGGSNGRHASTVGLLTEGGHGGGTLTIQSGGTIVNTGIINAIGGNANVEPAGSILPGNGGGGGGFLLFVSEGNITNSGTINANGGNGGDPGDADDDHAGGGGGGGMIHFVCPNASTIAGTNNISGGLKGVQPAGNIGSTGGDGGAGAGNGGLGGKDNNTIGLRPPENGFNGYVIRTQVTSACGFF